jgi:predicted oxidoreductase
MNEQHVLQRHLPLSSRLIFGCMGLGGGWDSMEYHSEHVQQANAAIDTALEAGITTFDHADIYTHGKAERVFGEVLKQRPELRKQMVIQSKCGIRFQQGQVPGRYDFSKSWIMESVEGILTRLNIEHLDVLLLHRPDPLMEVDEVAEAFSQLKQQGKVLHFGVSNMQAAQMDYLNSALTQPLVVNQLELSLSHLSWLEQGVTAGCSGQGVPNFSPGTIEYCQRNKVQLQSWGSLSRGLFSGRAVSEQPEAIQNTATLVAHLAAEYQVSREAIVLAWLMRHPANIQPVIGTTNAERIRACQSSLTVNLTREHWYQLYVSARGKALP